MRLSRRRIARPSPASSARSAETIDRARPSTKAFCRSASGRALPLGGISPALTRSCTLIQTARLAGSLASNSRPVRSSWPFRLTSLWQLVQ
jgi:hypothetical protein